jgi:adenosylcobyric acid synthase
VRDPEGVETGGDVAGLGLLPLTTVFAPAKVVARRQAVVRSLPGLFARCAGRPVAGYEIHMGRVSGVGPPVLDVGDDVEGRASADGWVVGTSVHGLLGDAGVRRGVLEALAERKGVTLPPPLPPAPDPFDALADGLEAALDMRMVDELVGVR